jgi:hypothetical protein
MNLLFSQQTNSLGRNGYMKCSGLDLCKGGLRDDLMLLSPLTSRGHVGRCELEIPLEDLPALIAGLQKLLPESPSRQARRRATNQ